jgi:hypothetical protein
MDKKLSSIPGTVSRVVLVFLDGTSRSMDYHDIIFHEHWLQITLKERCWWYPVNLINYIHEPHHFGPINLDSEESKKKK